jgi:hypothetical protein
MKVGMKVLVIIIASLSILLVAQIAKANVNPQKNEHIATADQDCQCGRIIFEDSKFFLYFEGDELPAELVAPPKWFTKKNITILDGAEVTFKLKCCECNGEIAECLELHSKNPGVEKLVHPKAPKSAKRSKR